MTLKTIYMFLGSLVLVLLAGCADKQFSSTGAVNTEPLTIDPAMQYRSNWEPSMAQYENGDVKHAAVGFAYVPKDAMQHDEYYYATDAGVFFLNSVTSPYTYYKTWGGMTSTGVQLPPTYTANPPLPPSPDAPAKVEETTNTTEVAPVAPPTNVEVAPSTQPTN